MSIWIVTVIAWAWVVWLANRPVTKIDSQVVLEPLLLFKVIIAVLIGGARIAGFIGVISAVAELPLLGRAANPWSALASGFATLGVAEVFARLVRTGRIEGSLTGIMLFSTFIPWTMVEGFAVSPSELVLETPQIRKAWNGWTGRLVLPLYGWHTARGAIETLQTLRDQAREGRGVS